MRSCPTPCARFIGPQSAGGRCRRYGAPGLGLFRQQLVRQTRHVVVDELAAISGMNTADHKRGAADDRLRASRSFASGSSCMRQEESDFGSALTLTLFSAKTQRDT